jgi:hypothetical protein
MANARRKLVALAGAALLPLVIAAAGAPAEAAAARALWTDAAAPSGRGDVEPERFRTIVFDVDALAADLDGAPREGSRSEPLVVFLPAPRGGYERFALVESPVMEPGLAQQHPEIATYAGEGIDDPNATIRADVSPLGFHASVRSSAGDWYVDPYRRGDDELHVSYFGSDLDNPRPELVETGEIEEPALPARAPGEDADSGPAVQLRTYRLALVSDPSYAAFHGAANVTAAKVALVNRLTQMYESEAAIRFILIAGNDALNLDTAAAASQPNGPCGGAPCFLAGQLDTCLAATAMRNRLVAGQIVGASSFDVGHVLLGNSGGGIAYLNGVGFGWKAQGCTGLAQPVGDRFAIEYLAHEVGHQLSATHTFNGVNGNCNVDNRSAATSVEPGAGSSIMAYANTCGADNLQANKDPYLSQRSRDQVMSHVTTVYANVQEVQTVSLVGFDGADSFRLRFGGNDSAPIVRGTNYTQSGIKAALEGIAGWPAGVTVTIAGFAGGTFDDTGFQVTFSGTTDRAALEVVDASGVSGFVGETEKGGMGTNNGTVSATGNNAPDVTAPAAFTIPTRTPFALTATGSDPNGDTVTYLWEQNDPGLATGTALFSNTKTNGPLFRQFGTQLQRPPYDPVVYNAAGINVPSTNPTRVFPDLPQILAGNTNAATGQCPASNVDCFSEFLPTSDYVGTGAGSSVLNFRVTVRDGRSGGGGIATANTALTLDRNAGPFLVTAPNTSAAQTGGSALGVTWNVAGTSTAPISAQNVKISLSLDDGLTYPHVLSASTPNDGAEVVPLPNVAATLARVKIEALGNVFFDVSDAGFPIAGSTLPETVIESGPTGPVSSIAPTFTFRSDPPGLVFECRVDAAAFASCTSPHTTSILSQGSHTFEVRAKNGADMDPTPASVAFVVDTIPPDTVMLSGPSGPTNVAAPSFTFAATEMGVTFECRVDAAPFASCLSPHQTATLSEGAHTFAVRARDAAGNQDATPATRSFTVDTVPPAVAIVSGPSGPTSSATSAFSFSGEAGATFECRVDAGSFGACSSPYVTGALVDGPHTFTVRARDAAGNEQQAQRSFTVDTVPPEVTIVSGPSGVIRTPAAAFGFASEPGATFQCRVDAAAFEPCSSPHTVAPQAPGAHAFQVRATDAAGNTSAPATRAFTYAPPLDTTITGRALKGANVALRFRGSGGLGALKFQCRLTGAKATAAQRAWSACASPKTYAKLKAGSYVFNVRSRDTTGSADPTPARSAFTIRKR